MDEHEHEHEHETETDRADDEIIQQLKNNIEKQSEVISSLAARLEQLENANGNSSDDEENANDNSSDDENAFVSWFSKKGGEEK